MIFLKTVDETVDVTLGTIEISKKEFFQNISHSTVINKYYQTAAGFDIEATSYMHNGEKHATMYIWQFAFLSNAHKNVSKRDILYVYGRTWEEWEEFIYELRKITANNKKLIIYVHNLAYEFHWIYTHTYFTKIFARKKRHPIYVESDNIIFKCSYMLSNYSLRNLAKERGYTLKETMDYSIKRLSCTPLNTEELNYALIDVKILTEYISDEIKRNGEIKSIPLTSTGYARRYCLDYIKSHENFIRYQKRIQYILPIDNELFSLLYQAYTGAFTHANLYYVHRTIEDVYCMDFTSSYPAVMCRKQFPGKFHKVDPTKMQLFKGKAMVMKITFTNISTTTSHTILSSHKCVTKDAKIDNGRIISASSLTVVINDLDLEIINLFYKYEMSQIETLYIADYRYLPENLIRAILDLYANKTTLKGVIGKEEAYLRSKELINAIYGMSVTNPLNDEIEFDVSNGEWTTKETNINRGLNKYYNNRNLFTAYQWGVWVTAWARWELLKTVYSIHEDVLYCDTDSIKCINDHSKDFEKENKRILSENERISRVMKLDENLYNPKTIEGEVKTLGLWDDEPQYKYFKTLGAKRYCYSYQDNYFEKKKEKLQTDTNFFITVAGLGKEVGKNAILKLAQKHNQSPYDIFSYDNPEISLDYHLKIDKDESNKMSFYYSKPENAFEDEEMDYLGNKTTIRETSFIHAENIEFNFGTTDEYLSLLGIFKVDTKRSGTFDVNRLKLKE